MNAFRQLAEAATDEARERGAENTPREIAQQPGTWRKAAALLVERADEVRAFMESTGLAGDHRDAALVMTGAGTSEFVGNAIAPVVQGLLGRRVVSVPTTHLVTHPEAVVVPGQRSVLLSFARSGNSPESVAACRFVEKVDPGVAHLVITCNRDGALARMAAERDDALCLVLPEETNDRGLAMTSSFSTMAFTATGLGLFGEPGELQSLAAKLGSGAERVMDAYGDVLCEVGSTPFDRASYLGSGALYGTMQECHLKMQEMTSGRVACRFDSFLGLRHGPQVFVDDRCLVVAALASDPRVRRYELDMLRQLKANDQGCCTVVVCDRLTDDVRAVCTHAIELFADGPAVADSFRVMTDVVVGQMLALFKCLALGLKPDNPSESGMINRVVQGVTIYDD